MRARRVIGHRILCDKRSCHPQHEGCHSEIFFNDKEILWSYENLQDRSIKLKDVFPQLEKLSMDNLDKDYITGIEFGYIICPICGERLFYGTRELLLPLIEKAKDEEEELEKAINYYKGNLYTPILDLINKDDIQRGQREASAFVSYSYGQMEKV